MMSPCFGFAVFHGQILNVLDPDDEIKEFMLGFSDDDMQLKVLTERRLRLMVLVKDKEVREERFWALVG